MSFDAKKFYLGKICNYRHEYLLGDGKSLRRKNNGTCVECDRFRAKKYYGINRTHSLTQAKKSHQAPANFDTYAHRLVVDDKPERDSDGRLSVACAYCGGRFRPSRGVVTSRIQSLENKLKGERRFYCGDPCKQACPTFHRKKTFKNQKGAIGTSYEVPAWLRQEAFKRDNWKCKKCGAGKEAILHAHHIKPKAEFPPEAADLENIITVCKKCHNEIHHLPGCGYGEIGQC